MLPISSLLAAILTIQCHGFIASPRITQFHQQKSPFSITKPAIKPNTSLHLSEAELTESIISARQLFFLWFFGASGGGGIAVGQFPKMFSRFSATFELKDKGPSKGGETIGIIIPFIWGYPQDVSRADVESILKNKMTVEKMVQTGPKDFWSERGYLRYDAFEAANPKSNPLAIQIIYDAISNSATVAPDVAQDALTSFQQDETLGVLKNQLYGSKLKGYSAIGFLLFLLGIAADTCLDALAEGWFPDWPGSFPWGLVNPGIWTIPDYWI